MAKLRPACRNVLTVLRASGATLLSQRELPDGFNRQGGRNYASGEVLRLMEREGLILFDREPGPAGTSLAWRYGYRITEAGHRALKEEG